MTLIIKQNLDEKLIFHFAKESFFEVAEYIFDSIIDEELENHDQHDNALVIKTSKGNIFLYELEKGDKNLLFRIENGIHLIGKNYSEEALEILAQNQSNKIIQVPRTFNKIKKCLSL